VLLDELVNRRNNIAHGADSTPVKETDYERLRKAVFQTMDELTLSIVAAIENAQFSRAQTPTAATGSVATPSTAEQRSGMFRVLGGYAWDGRERPTG